VAVNDARKAGMAAHRSLSRVRARQDDRNTRIDLQAGRSFTPDRRPPRAGRRDLEGIRPQGDGSGAHNPATGRYVLSGRVGSWKPRRGADALVLVTEWNEFRALSSAQLAGTMRGRIVIDLRNVNDPVAMPKGPAEPRNKSAQEHP
jgi:hypothetical protein